MSKYRFSIFSLIVISISALSLLSCKSGNRSDSAKDGELNDSIFSPAPSVLPLPDTVYSSAQTVNFTVEVKDSSANPIIDNLNSLYGPTGSFTFRQNGQRDASFGGKIDKVPTGFKIDWTFKTEENWKETKLGAWGGGSGWTGQPLYIEWPDSLLKKLKKNKVVAENFSGKEIIIGSLCGNVYFIDYTTGQLSREPVKGLNPIKGTTSFDPIFNGNLYVGQGVPVERPFGAFCINLFTNKITEFFDEDPKALRHWGAYDSSPIRVGQFLFRPGENGSVYKFILENNIPVLHSVLRYRINGVAPGIESSMAVWLNYGFIADNNGNIIAINLNTMQPVWYYCIGDDTDSTPVIQIEDGQPYLYSGCEVDKTKEGNAKFVKLNALNGEQIWITEIPSRQLNNGSKPMDGGYFASPLPGFGDCSDMIFNNCVKNSDGHNGSFYAYDKKTGKIIYEIPLKTYAWSSPVAFLGPNNKMYVVTGDCAGNLYMIDPKDGKILFSEHIGNNFESSPVVIGNSFVVGSRTNNIFKITVI